jgi:hypothetical protein
MASDRRTGGRLEDHPDQPRAAFGRARRDAGCRTCLCSCALDPTRVAKSSPLRHQRHRAQRAIRRSPNAHRELPRAGVVPVHPCGSEFEHRRCRNEATAGARPRSVRVAELDDTQPTALAPNSCPPFHSKQESGANHARPRSERPRQRSQGGQLRMEPLWSPAVATSGNR